MIEAFCSDYVLPCSRHPVAPCKATRFSAVRNFPQFCLIAGL